MGIATEATHAMPAAREGSGWVEYVPLEPLAGMPGLAMLWRDLSGGLRVATAAHGLVGESREACRVARVGHRESPHDAIVAACRTDPASYGDDHALPVMLPGPEETHDRARLGFPPLEEHRATATAAVLSAGLPADMRDACLACLARGIPEAAGYIPLFRSFHDGDALWPYLGFAALHPEIASVAFETLSLDEFVPLDPAAGACTVIPGLDAPMLRRFRDLGPKGRDVLTRGGGWHARHCVELAASVPPDWFPSDDGWEDFLGVAVVVRCLRHCGLSELPAGPLALTSGGDWGGYLRRLHAALGIPWERGEIGPLADHAADAADPVHQLARSLILPLLARSGLLGDGISEAGSWPNAAACSLLYGGRSALSVLKLSRRWHALWDSIEAQAGPGRAVDWPPLFEGTFRHGDVEAVALRDSVSLSEEGAREADRDGVPGLSHCVATRVASCLKGRSHVLSIRHRAPDGTVTRLSTCEVTARRAGGGVVATVTEHKGLSNAHPCPEAVQAAVALADALASGKLPAVPEALAPREERDVDEVSRECGYDWRDGDAVARVLAAWEPLLPRWARGLGPDGLVGELVARRPLPANVWSRGR